ncbi:restriction endonuclease subunit S [Tyzzerella nexilis]|nr:restriction endonuclease subunit S [[Clostridium] nexile]
MSNRRVRLADIAELTVGYVGNMAKQYKETGVKFLRSLNIKPFHIVEDDLKYISKEFSESLSKSILHENDLIIVRTGMPGTCCVVPKEYENCNCADVVIVRPNLKKVNPHYLAAYINVWGKKQVENNKVGAIQKHFNVKSAEEMVIDLPDLEQQYKVAKVLTDLNGKIFINEKINDYLCDQIQLLFSYFFNLSSVPETWSKGVLSDIADITMGQSPSGNSYNIIGKGCPFYQGSTDFGAIFPAIRMYTNKPSRYALALDTLLSVRAPVGSLNIAFENCCIGRGLASIHGKNDNNIFVRYLIKNNRWYFDNINNSGTTFGSITKDYLFGMPITIPEDKLVAMFEHKSSLIEQQIYANEQQIRELQSLRNWLLPVLMNGQATIID